MEPSPVWLVFAELAKMSFSPAIDNLFAYGEPMVQVLLDHTPDEGAKREYLKRFLDGGYCTIFATDPSQALIWARCGLSRA